MSWYDESVSAIEKLDASLSPDLPLADRKNALRLAYPFKAGHYEPYQMWCKAQREYLERFAS